MRKSAVIAIFLFIIICFFSCLQNNRTEEESKSVYASLIDTTAYVGKQACNQCHSDKFETFSHTGMGMSFDVASRKKSSAVFSVHEVIIDKFKNFSYHPFFKGDSLFITEFRLKGRDTVYSRTERISYVVGSGQHTNSHMINVNGYVTQAPATFFTQKGKWDFPPGFENGFNSRFNRMIELECMSCHNAYPKIVLGSQNKYESIPSGIDCERCHGPGSKHIADKLSGKIVDVKKEIDYSIVNPAKLPVDLQLDICQRCHIQGNAVLRAGKSFFDFRPGMHLAEVMNVFMPVYKGDDDSHIMASHAERMKMSKCFIVSKEKAEVYNKTHTSLTPYKNAMTCITCHDPHVSVRASNPEVFNNACRSCHAGVEKTDQLHSTLSCTAPLIDRTKQKDDCAGCHMPKNGAIDIPHVRVTDHWIRKPVKHTDAIKIREFVRLACINNPTVESVVVGEAFLNYYEKFVANPAYLDSAKKYIPDGNSENVRRYFHDLIRWAFLKNDYGKVKEYEKMHGAVSDSLHHMNYSNEDAWTSYRIGEAYSHLQASSNAIFYYALAVKLAPYQLDFRNKLAGAQDDAGKTREAAENYSFILKENPEYVSAYINYGFLLLRTQHTTEKPLQFYEKALALDPDNIQALLNKAGVFIFSGKKAEAVSCLKRVLEIDPSTEQAKMILDQLALPSQRR